MLYPKFLKKDDIIGITALSSGVGINDLPETKISLNHLKKNYRLIITPNVYSEGYVSSDIKTRIEEFNNLLNEDISMLYNIRGGDFLYETLDGLDYQKIKKKNIWVQGYSDPTSLLYILTTKYDIATIYGFNAKSYNDEELLPYQKNNLEIIKGNLVIQKSFMDRETKSIHGNFKDSGMIIGGCLDILRYLVGTKYDNTLNFIKKYRKKKFIWYFDIFTMDSVDTYLCLLQLKSIGWFDDCNTIIFGSVLFPKEECDLTYKEAFNKAFPDKNIIYDANIGHVDPVFTIINGSIAKVEYLNNKMILDMELMDENNS